jgi:hypothetical protein
VVENKDGWTSIPAASADAVAKVPGVSGYSAVRLSQAQVKGVSGKPGVTGVDTATLPSVYQVDWKHGSNATLGSLSANDAIVSESWSKSKHKKVGEQIQVTTQNGKHATYTIVGTYKNNAHFLGDVTESRRTSSCSTRSSPAPTPSR